ARGDDGCDDGDLAIAPDEAAIAVGVQDLRGRQQVIDPPYAEGQPDAGNADEGRVQVPALFLDDGRQRGDRADNAFAQGNDGEQAVALCDMMGMPGRAAVAALGNHRAGKFDDGEDDGEQDADTDGKIQHDLHDPADLRDRYGDGIGEA